MKRGIQAGVLLFFLGVQNYVTGQNIAVDESLTPTQLVETILINNPCANISNVTATGWAFNSGNSFGKFTAETSTFPFFDGLVLTTGRAQSAIGPNNSLLSEGPDSWNGDAELETALNISQNSSINATILEFDFLPLADKISFDYIFSSEQYLSNPSNNQCNFTDGFVFLLKKANTTDSYVNLAVVPGTDIPVRINTVRGNGTICPPANEQFFDAFNTSNHPTNYNGQTKIMTAKSIVEPGTLYHIKLVVADQGNRQYDSAIFLGGGSFKIEKDLGDDRILATNNPLCFESTLNLDATEPGNNTYKWFKNGIEITGATNPIYQVIEAGIYKVEINLDNSGCISSGEIEIEYAAQLSPSPATIVQCDTDADGITTFNLTKAATIIQSTDSSIQSIEYFLDAAATNQIANPAAFNSAATTVFAQVFNNTGCSATVAITLSIANQNPNNPSPISFCDLDANKDGFRTFNLTDDVSSEVLNGLPTGLVVSYFSNANNALLSINPLSNLFTNTTAGQEIIWARITNGPDCYGIIPITLVVNYLEAPDFDDEFVTFCNGISGTTLSVDLGYSSYLWDNAAGSTSNSITVNAAGTYTVKVTDINGCSDRKRFLVNTLDTPTITGVTISDFNGGENTVTIEYTGSGDLRFSLDGNSYQDSPVFNNVPSGIYIAFVENLCGPRSREIVVLDYPHFFTPNGDGYNDVWSIPYLQNQNRRAQLHVFDRYGKLVYSGTGDNDGWDGTLQSNPLPSSDYWFTLTLENKRVIKGHFSLKR